jgi:hypothetical protein
MTAFDLGTWSNPKDFVWLFSKALSIVSDYPQGVPLRVWCHFR